MAKKKAFIVIALFIIAFIMLIPFASSWPDGLENAMEHFNVSEHAIYHPPLDYGDTFFQSFFAAFLGMLLAGGLTTIYIKVVRRA